MYYEINNEGRNFISNSVKKSCGKKNDLVTRSAVGEIEQSKFENNRFVSNMSEKEPYQTVYNNATIKNSNYKSMNELSDDEINEEINLRIYKEKKLDKSGIEFNSKEFENWLEENKNTFPVPLDAPAKLRKEVYNMLDSAKDPAKYFLLRDFTRGFRKVKDHNDLNSYMEATNNILKWNNDYLELVKMDGSDNPIIKKSIDNFIEIVNEISTFKIKLSYLLLDNNSVMKK